MYFCKGKSDTSLILPFLYRLVRYCSSLYTDTLDEIAIYTQLAAETSVYLDAYEELGENEYNLNAKKVLISAVKAM